MDNCKRKLLSITPWTRSIIVSIETWPKCHVFTEWGQNNLTQKSCGGCHQPGVSVRFLLFGHPYNINTMQTVPTDIRVTYEKVKLVILTFKISLLKLLNFFKGYSTLSNMRCSCGYIP